MRILKRLLDFIASRMLLITVVCALLVISFYLAQDPVLQVGLSDTSPYKDYEIRGYDHRVKMVSVWSWPWENVARAEVVESIPAIDGTIRSSKREAALAEGGEARLSPPEWTTTRYRVTLVRTAGKWLISNLQAISK